MPYTPESLQDLAVNVRNIIGGLTLPEVFKECPRFNGVGSGKATVAKTLKQEFDLTWPSTGQLNLPPNEQQIFQFRNLLRNLIYAYRQCPTYVYDWLSPKGLLNWDLNVKGTTRGDSGCWAYADPASSAQPHGTKLFPGRGKGRFGIWVDNDGGGAQKFNIAFVVGTGATPPDAGTYVVSNYWTGRDWAPLDSHTFTGLDSFYQSKAPPGGAYMNWDVYAPAGGFTVANLQFLISSVSVAPSDVWAHRPVTNIDELLPIIEGVRVNGAVAWMRNEAPQLYEQGKIVGADVSKAVPWSNVATGSVAVQAMDEYYSGPAQVGAYGFLTPDDEEDFQMTNDVSITALKASTQNLASFPLQERSPYITLCASVGDQNSNSRKFTLISWTMVEYLSNSKVQAKENSKYSEKDWDIAIEYMKKMRQIYENKFHIEDIFEAISNFGAPISQAAAEVLRFFPQTAAIGEAIKGEGFQGAIKRLGTAAVDMRNKRQKR